MSRCVESLRRSRSAPGRHWLMRILAPRLALQAFHAAKHAIGHRPAALEALYRAAW
jgi:hypothetical protein